MTKGKETNRSTKKEREMRKRVTKKKENHRRWLPLLGATVRFTSGLR